MSLVPTPSPSTYFFNFQRGLFESSRNSIRVFMLLLLTVYYVFLDAWCCSRTCLSLAVCLAPHILNISHICHLFLYLVPSTFVFAVCSPWFPGQNYIFKTYSYATYILVTTGSMLNQQLIQGYQYAGLNKNFRSDQYSQIRDARSHMTHHVTHLAAFLQSLVKIILIQFNSPYSVVGIFDITLGYPLTLLFTNPLAVKSAKVITHYVLVNCNTLSYYLGTLSTPILYITLCLLSKMLRFIFCNPATNQTEPSNKSSNKFSRTIRSSRASRNE
jgi:hypothetical protein